MAGFPLLAWALVGLAAVFAGVILARRYNRPDEWWLKRGSCPSCHARKSLLTTPISPSAVTLTCGGCAGQWRISNVDGEPIVDGPAPRAVLPKLFYTTSLKTGNPVFRTDVGEIEIDLFNGKLHDFVGVRTPRELLKRCYELAADVDRIELKEPFNAGTRERQIEIFMESAGIDLPIREHSDT